MKPLALIDPLFLSIGQFSFAAQIPMPPTGYTYAWLARQMGANYNTGDTVTQWDDLGGTANHMVQAGAAALPLYDPTGGPGNGPCVDFFPGSARWMRTQSTFTGISGPLTIGMLVQKNGTGNNRYCISGGTDATTRCDIARTTNAHFIYRGNSFTPTVSFTGLGVWYAIIGYFNGAASWMSVAGVVQASSNDVGSQTPTRWTLGGFNSLASSNQWNGKIAETMIYAGDRRTDLQAYFASRGF